MLARVQLVTLACYAIAAVAFTRDAMRDGDDLIGWFGAAAVIAAWAQVTTFWSQTLNPDWLSLADMLRLTFFVLLFRLCGPRDPAPLGGPDLGGCLLRAPPAGA